MIDPSENPLVLEVIIAIIKIEETMVAETECFRIPKNSFAGSGAAQRQRNAL